MRYLLLSLLFTSPGAVCFSQGTPVPMGELKDANTELTMLGGQKGNTVALLATVKQDIQVFEETVLKPHNIDAANQRAEMAAAEAAPYDAYSESSVKAHNDRILRAEAWGKTVNDRKDRETPRYVAMKTQEKNYEQTIANLEAKITAIIRRYVPDCNAGDAEEALVNCWAAYWDGATHQKPLGEDPVYPGTNFFGSGVPTVSSDAFKTFRNKQLEDINSGIRHIVVPKPPPPPPPQGMIEKATEKAKTYFQNLIYGQDRFKMRRTTAVLAVRG